MEHSMAPTSTTVRATASAAVPVQGPSCPVRQLTPAPHGFVRIQFPDGTVGFRRARNVSF